MASGSPATVRIRSRSPTPTIFSIDAAQDAQNDEDEVAPDDRPRVRFAPDVFRPSELSEVVKVLKDIQSDVHQFKQNYDQHQLELHAASLIEKEHEKEKASRALKGSARYKIMRIIAQLKAITVLIAVIVIAVFLSRAGTSEQISEPSSQDAEQWSNADGA